MDIETYALAKSYTDKKVKNIDVEGEVAKQLQNLVPDAVADYCDEHYSEWSGALDDTLEQPNMAAPASKVGELKSALTQIEDAAFVHTENMYNYEVAEDGKVLNSSGNGTSDSTTHFVSAYMDVSSLNSVTIYRDNLGVSAFNAYYVIYDSSKVNIGTRGVGSVVDTSSASFLRISAPSEVIDKLMVVRTDFVPTEYIPWSFNFKYLPNILKNTADIEAIEDLLDEIQMHSVTYTLPTYEDHEMSVNGSIGGSNSYKHTEKLSVQEGDKVFLYADGMSYDYFTNHRYNMRIVTAFNGDAAIPASGMADASGSYTVPHGIDYVVVSVYVSNITTFTNLYVAVDRAETVIAEKDPTNILVGKKWVACGDSFTETGYSTADGVPLNQYMFATGVMFGKYITYPQIIGERNHMTIVNLAKSGMTMTDIDGSYANSFTHGGDSAVYKQIPNDADYITIKLGINDLNHDAPLGTIDSTDITTFYGAYNTALSWIVTHHPFAKIGVIVTNGTSANTVYVDAIKAVAKKWGVPYLDEYYDEKIPLLHRANRPDVTADVLTYKIEQFRVSVSNTHPNTKAHYYEASFVEDWLRRL